VAAIPDAVGMSRTLQGKTIFITGASRGIGRAIALRCARDGANIVLASKTSDPHPKLPGTIHSVAAEVVEAGGKALAVQVDVRFEEEVQKAVEQAAAAFGGIDVLVNNAGAISLTTIEQTPVKKFDLMLGINARAVFLCTKLCLPHLEASAAAGKNPHVLSLSPPVSLDPRWIKGHAAYTLSKYGMTLLTMGLAEEFRERKIAVNALWPRTVISTAAIEMLMGDAGMKQSRTPEIMADAAWEIVTTPGVELTGQAILDEDLLRERGVTDFDKYLSSPGGEPLPDLYVGEPWG
jgi:citronellol/citronellal dehydrogenase